MLIRILFLIFISLFLNSCGKYTSEKVIPAHIEVIQTTIHLEKSLIENITKIFN